MKPNKNWFVGVFNCLDHDQMVRSRICMSKDTNLTNSLRWAIYFASLDGWAKIFKTLDFWFLVTLHNIDQLQRIDLCHSERIRVWILPTQIPTSNIQIQNPLHWSCSILFKVIKDQNPSILNTSCPSTKWVQNGRLKVVSWLVQRCKIIET